MKLIVGVVSVTALLFVLCFISTTIGAAVGWAVGLIFSDVILDFLSRIGIDVSGLHMWQVGASLGFIGSFFRASYSTKSEK